MELEPIKIPKHVGIIVDGNGRWAKSRGLSRSMGHKEGAKNLDCLTKYMLEKGINVLSFYVFSTENFKRSTEEVNYLMNLFVQEFKKKLKEYQKLGVKVIFSGRREPLREEVLNVMAEITEKTKENKNGIVNFCLNYGGHAEIVDTCRKLAEKVKNGTLEITEIDEKLFEENLYQSLPPIDLMIRTSGEMRISNFMLWQCSYAEFYFPKTLFPDFKEADFEEAIYAYNKRDRRFGGIHDENQNH